MLAVVPLGVELSAPQVGQLVHFVEIIKAVPVGRKGKLPWPQLVQPGHLMLQKAEEPEGFSPLCSIGFQKGQDPGQIPVSRRPEVAEAPLPPQPDGQKALHIGNGDLISRRPDQQGSEIILAGPDGVARQPFLGPTSVGDIGGVKVDHKKSPLLV